MAKKLKTDGVAQKIGIINDASKQDKKEEEVTNFIPIDSILFNQDNIFNLDDSDESIQELAENIKEHGLLHNIVVVETEPNKYLLISGERRTKAMKYLGEKTIKATIKHNASELEVLKMLFFANSETREYTIEEKVQIIKGFTEKLKRFENTSEKESAQKFKQYVAQAFNINERQAYKLISISNELIEPLKASLFADVIGINTAASLAQLPEEYQKYSVEIIDTASKNGDKKFVEGQAEDFAKRTKNIISKANTSLAKQHTSRMYYDTKLAQAQDDLAKANLELKASDSENNQELVDRKNKAENTISKCTTILEQLNKDLDVEKQKQDSEINKIYTNTIFSVGKGLDDVQKDKSGKIAQSKKIAKEIQNVDNAIKKLLNMSPAEELKTIQKLLEETYSYTKVYSRL